MKLVHNFRSPLFVTGLTDRSREPLINITIVIATINSIDNGGRDGELSGFGGGRFVSQN
jgi:hypothetical protein